MKLLNRFLRTYFTRFYIRKGIARDESKHAKELRAEKLTPEERYEWESFQHASLQEWCEWLTSIEDVELVKKAQKMDIYLDEIPIPAQDNEDMRRIKGTHYTYNDFGERLLEYESRKAIIKAIRERTPSYRKERREIWEFWLKSGGIIIGIIGAATGFFAVYNK